MKYGYALCESEETWNSIANRELDRVKKQLKHKAVPWQVREHIEWNVTRHQRSELPQPDDAVARSVEASTD